MPNLNHLTQQDLQWGTQNWSSQDYIAGLKMVWNSTTSISVTSGAAFIPASGTLISNPATLTLPGLALTASTWYHVYLYLNAGVPAIECVTTAPDAPYYGTARAKTGDTSRRYIGSVLTDASGNIRNFKHLVNAGTVLYPAVSSQLRLLANGGATTSTLIDCSAAIPTGASSIGARFLNNASTTDTLWFDSGDITISSTSYFLAVGFNGATAFQFCPVNASRQIAYMHSAVAGGAYVDPYGYTYER